MFQRTQRLPSQSTFYVPNPPSPWDTTSRHHFLVSSFGVQHSSPAALQQIFQSIHPYNITPEVAWTVSPIWKVCKVGPAPRKISCLCSARGGGGYEYLQGEKIRSYCGRPLLYQTASHHLTQSTKGIFARTVTAPSFQSRYPGTHPSDVPDARPRSLLASPPSET